MADEEKGLLKTYGSSITSVGRVSPIAGSFDHILKIEAEEQVEYPMLKYVFVDPTEIDTVVAGMQQGNAYYFDHENQKIVQKVELKGQVDKSQIAPDGKDDVIFVIAADEPMTVFVQKVYGGVNQVASFDEVPNSGTISAMITSTAPGTIRVWAVSDKRFTKPVEVAVQ